MPLIAVNFHLSLHVYIYVSECALTSSTLFPTCMTDLITTLSSWFPLLLGYSIGNMKCVGVCKRALRPLYDYDSLYCTSQFKHKLKALSLYFSLPVSPPQPFHPMVNLVCSSDLRMFLCALYAPVCIEYGRVSMPCRSLCQRAKDECHKLMEIFGVAWPDDMECSRCVCVCTAF